MDMFRLNGSLMIEYDGMKDGEEGEKKYEERRRGVEE